MVNEWDWEEETQNFKNAYRAWILREMHAEEYGILFDVLYDTEFTWREDLAMMDMNRESEGRYLRRRFVDETEVRPPLGYLEWPASFLEVVVALAFKVDDMIMYDPSTPDGPWTWFWEWMDNAGLSYYDDHQMLVGNQAAFMMVSARVNAIMDRRYDPSGEGGFFPLEDPGCDQRTEEMWFQANSYMIEKHLERR